MNETISIYCLGSGSSGNCYAFEKHGEVVLVECGLEYPILQKKLIENGILPTQIKTVICTHQHSDHTKSLLELFRRGIQFHICCAACSGDCAAVRLAGVEAEA